MRFVLGYGLLGTVFASLVRMVPRVLGTIGLIMDYEVGWLENSTENCYNS